MRTRLVCLGVMLMGSAYAQAEEPRAVIERAIKAMGGEETLAAHIKAAHAAKARGYMMPLGIRARLTSSVEILCQNRTTLRNDATLEFEGRKFEIVDVFVDGKGWQKDADGKIKDSTDEVIAEHHDRIHRDAILHVLPLLKDKQYTLTMQDDGVVDDKPTWTVKVAHKEFSDSILSFDKRSGFLVKLSYLDAKGKRHDTYFAEYRELGREHDERVLRDAGLAVDTKSLLAFLRRLDPEPAKLAAARELVRKLADDSFDVRESAAKGLIEIGKVAESALRQAMKDGDAEVVRRAKDCLTQIDRRTNDAVLIAAVRLVGWTQPKGGAEAVLAMLPGVPEPVVKEARAVLVACAGAKPDGAIVKALEDANPVRKAAARAVLGKDGGEYLKQPGRTIFIRGLKDSLKYRYDFDGRTLAEDEVVEWRWVNGHDPKVFEKPKGN